MAILDRQEFGAGFLFFATCGRLILDVVLSAPREAPALWPLVPMFAAVGWTVGVDHLRRARPTPLPAPGEACER